MNGIEALLVDLVQAAESPLYSSYRWLGRQLGRDVSMPEFLRLVDRLVQLDVLRLWSVDPKSRERTRLPAVPQGLAQQYAGIEDLDDGFDPFVLSLTLGPAADVDSAPEWEVDLDFDHGTFRLKANAGVESMAMRRLALLFPDVELIEQHRALHAADSIELAGSLAVISASDGSTVTQGC